MAYSGAADYSSGAPDVGFWEGGDPLWVAAPGQGIWAA